MMSFGKTLFLFLGLTQFSLGQVTLQFSNFSSALTNLSDAGGTEGTNGLVWGIVIDTEGDGFGDFAVELDQASLLSDGLEVSSGDFYYFGNLTIERPASLSDSGPGTVSTSRNMPVYSNPAVVQGQAFALVWFESSVAEESILRAGSRYGRITNPSFVLPPNPSTNAPFSSLFAGDDPVRPANLTVQGILPEIDCGIAESRFAIDFQVDARTAENVTFDLETLVLGEPNSWSLEGVTPEILESSGDFQTLRLSFPETILEEPEVLTRVRVLPVPQ